MTPERARIIVGASGSGTTFRAVADTIERWNGTGRDLGYDIAAVVSDRAQPGVFDQVDEVNEAYGWDIQKYTVTKRDFPGGPQPRGQTLEQADRLASLVAELGSPPVILMGWMSVLHPLSVLAIGGSWPELTELEPTHRGKFLVTAANTHPGILPQTADTYGVAASARAISLGLEHTAHTFHILDVGVDTGATLAQNKAIIPRHNFIGCDEQDERVLDMANRVVFPFVQEVEKSHLPWDIKAWLVKSRAFREANPQLTYDLADARRAELGRLVVLAQAQQAQLIGGGYKFSTPLLRLAGLQRQSTQP